MALSLNEQMMLEQVREGIAATGNDDDAMMMLGMVDGDLLFNADGTVTELCTALADSLKEAKPHLTSRVDAFIAASGNAAP